MFSQIDGAITMVEKQIDYLRNAWVMPFPKKTIFLTIGRLFLAPSLVYRKLSIKEDYRMSQFNNNQRAYYPLNQTTNFKVNKYL